MGSSAQNSSGVHWCRHPVRFNEVPEKVPKVPEVWEALVQSQVKFNRVREKVPEQVPDKVGEALVQSQAKSNGRSLPSQVRFNRVSKKVWEVPEKVAEKVPEKVVGILRSGEGSGEVCFSSFCFSGMCADGMNGCH